MQKCLNDDASYYFAKFKEYPAILVLLILFIISSISILLLSLLCNIKYPCSYEQQDVSLYFGMMLTIFCVVFIGLPCCLRFILNGIFYEPPILPVTVESPITRPRSRSKEKKLHSHV